MRNLWGFGWLLLAAAAVLVLWWCLGVLWLAHGFIELVWRFVNWVVDGAVEWD